MTVQLLPLPSRYSTFVAPRATRRRSRPPDSWRPGQRAFGSSQFLVREPARTRSPDAPVFGRGRSREVIIFAYGFVAGDF